MGRQSPWRIRARRRRSLRMPFDLIIFTMILALTFFDRFLSVAALASGIGCDYGQQVMFGFTPQIPGTHNVLIWAGGLTCLLLLSQGIGALIERKKFSLTAITFGCLNALMLFAVMRQMGVSWAFFHPDEPLAAYIQASNRQIAMEYASDFFDDRPKGEPRLKYDPSAWHCVSGNGEDCLYRNEELGLTARKMLIGQCFTEEINRLNWQALTDAPYPERHPNTDIDYVYFDPEGRWIRPSRWDHPNTKNVQAVLTEEQLQRSEYSWWEMEELLWDQYERRQQPSEPARPFTREEIDMMVANNWGDERPVWWKPE